MPKKASTQRKINNSLMYRSRMMAKSLGVSIRNAKVDTSEGVDEPPSPDQGPITRAKASGLSIKPAKVYTSEDEDQTPDQVPTSGLSIEPAKGYMSEGVNQTPDKGPTSGLSIEPAKGYMSEGVNQTPEPQESREEVLTRLLTHEVQKNQNLELMNLQLRQEKEMMEALCTKRLREQGGAHARDLAEMRKHYQTMLLDTSFNHLE